MRRALLCLVVACSTPPRSPEPAKPPVAPAAPATKSKVVTETFHSDALGVDKDVRVYLPAGYDPAGSKRYPVFYYLHGITGDETNWVDLAKLDQAADAMQLGAIVVMPDGDNNFYFDSAMPIDYEACVNEGAGLFLPFQPRLKTCVKASHYETYITKDLIAWVDRTFKTIAAREGRGIAGVSMGGYGALMLALRHTDLFAATASHSGVAALLYKEPHPYVKGKVALYTGLEDNKAATGKFGEWIRALFGTDIENYRAHDPSLLVDKLAPGKLALYMDCGTEDEFALNDGMQYLHDRLLERNIPHEYFLGPGRHNFAFFTARLPNSLAFLAKSVVRARIAR